MAEETRYTLSCLGFLKLIGGWGYFSPLHRELPAGKLVIGSSNDLRRILFVVIGTSLRHRPASVRSTRQKSLASSEECAK
ncbi:hypothetical protein PspLS_05612 [Pyricularia sp. CBS 133598]|nr:hypothetical protein PspLS_05612 [Pyricularia sp. CBS 133598]